MEAESGRKGIDADVLAAEAAEDESVEPDDGDRCWPPVATGGTDAPGPSLRQPRAVGAGGLLTMSAPATRRSSRRLSAAVLSCLLTAVAARTASRGRTSSEQGAPAPAQERRGRGPGRSTIRIAQAHKTSTGEDVTIALIDSGIDLSVPEDQGADIRMGLDCREKRAKPRTGPHAGHGTGRAALLVGNGRGPAREEQAWAR